jgi:hypothetical protein
VQDLPRTGLLAASPECSSIAAARVLALRSTGNVTKAKTTIRQHHTAQRQ